ncbi:MAG: hypothetical protein ACE5F1_14480 [Planctomycetota bacterium]
MRILPALLPALVASLLPCLGSAARSQTRQLVFPPQASKAEGNLDAHDQSLGAPWWTHQDSTTNARNFRLMLVSDLPRATKGSIVELAWRRDGLEDAGFHTEQFAIDIRLALSTARTTSSTLSKTFARNRGSDAVTVISKKRIIFGSQEFLGTFPEPFAFTLPFDKPFPFDASRGSLCMDLEHYDNTLYDPFQKVEHHVHVDGIGSSILGPELKAGPRCFSPNPWLPPITLDQNLFVFSDPIKKVNRLRYYAERSWAQHHSLGLLVVSFGKLNKGFPLDCGEFLMDFSRTLLMTIHASDDHGKIRWPSAGYLFDIPYRLEHGGLQLYAQEANLDVHSQKTAVSNWSLGQVPIFLGAGRGFGLRGVHAEGAGSLGAAAGTLSAAGQGPVIRYTIK